LSFSNLRHTFCVMIVAKWSPKPDVFSDFVPIVLPEISRSAYRNFSVKARFVTHSVEWLGDEWLGVIITTVSDDSKCQTQRATSPTNTYSSPRIKTWRTLEFPLHRKGQNPLTAPGFVYRANLLPPDVLPARSWLRDHEDIRHGARCPPRVDSCVCVCVCVVSKRQNNSLADTANSQLIFTSSDSSNMKPCALWNDGQGQHM